MTNLCFFYITIPNEEEGEAIAKALLQKKLIACANILPAHQSYYVWKDEFCSEKEHVMILKTTQALQKQVETEVKSLHPYECPCILSFTPTTGNTDFIKWIESQVS